MSAGALDRYVRENAERHTDELRDLCAIPSEASDPAALARAAAWCAERLRAAGAEARVLSEPGAPPLVVGEVGGGPRTLICVQHYDVQPAVPLDLWHTPPYEPAVRDGALYARGADDNKGHLLMRIQAVEAHRAALGDLGIRVRFLIEGEEESGSPHLGRLLDREPGLRDGDGALKEGGGIDSSGRPNLLLGGKGICYVELRVRTLAGDAHSGGATYLPSAAWRLVNALSTLMDERGRVLIDGFYDDVRRPSDAEVALVRALPTDAAEIKRVFGLERFAFGIADEEMRVRSQFEPTCNIAGIWSGFTSPGTKTVIPSVAACKIDFRLVPDQDPARVVALLRAHLDRHGFGDVQVEGKEGTRPYRGRADDPLVRAAKAAAEEAFGAEALLVPTSGGTSPMWEVCAKRGLANVTLGMGHPGAGAHAPNEHIRLANYRTAMGATARLYARFATQA